MLFGKQENGHRNLKPVVFNEVMMRLLSTMLYIREDNAHLDAIGLVLKWKEFLRTVYLILIVLHLSFACLF